MLGVSSAAVCLEHLVTDLCRQISAGFIYVTQGYISMSYSEERERGKFVSTAINLQALGALIGGLIPLIMNRNKVSDDLLRDQSGFWGKSEN
jgi:MFS family permease